jgi:hypothetical protein
MLKSSTLASQKKSLLLCYIYRLVNAAGNIRVLSAKNHNKENSTKKYAAFNVQPGGTHSNRCALEGKQGTHALL